MIDLHCHILPGVDDGAVDLPESFAMARAALADGSTAVVASSHLGESLFDTSAELIRTAHAEVIAALAREGIPLTVHPGAENYLGEIDAAAFARDAVGLGEANVAVLFDFSMRHPPEHVGEAIEALLAGGRTPLLAHPERNLRLQSDPSLIAEWIERGALIQVNAPSLLGTLGAESKILGLRLLEAGAVHLLASDAHNLKTRPFCLGPAKRIAAEIVGEEEAHQMTEGRQAAILRGESVTSPKRPTGELAGSRKGFFSKLWSRGSR